MQRTVVFAFVKTKCNGIIAFLSSVIHQRYETGRKAGFDLWAYMFMGYMMDK